MPNQTAQSIRTESVFRRHTWLAVAVLAVAIGVVYGRSLHIPFLFDDSTSVVANTSIRSLWPLIGDEEHRGPLNPARDLPTSARPLVNYSFALNYRLGGLNVVGFHLVNLVIHFLCALLLFAIVRRVLRLPYFGGRFDAGASSLAFAAALFWSVHPLLTDAVAYITQRTELMMAWFYLATLYCSLRYWDLLPLPPGESGAEGASLRPRRTKWLTLAILACLGGMLSKEVMISAPIVVLLFERTFIARSFASALRRSWPLYLGLAVTWIPLLVLSAASPRSQSAGFHLEDSPITYWLTQCKVLLMYLKLAVWPWPLLCHYELPKVDTFATFCIYVIPVLLMSALTIELVRRNHSVGFVLFFVGAILAPTSIIPVLTEKAAERRMYLPLAALMVLVVIGIYLFVRRQLALSASAGERTPGSKGALTAGIVSVAALGVLYGVVTVHRLGDYYNETLMWQQVVEAQPFNHVAHYNLGILYNQAGREAESLTELQASVAAHPGYPNARSALGFALVHAGRIPEAIESIKVALEIEPDRVGALNNMGIALIRMERYSEAVEYLEHAIRINPTLADAHNNLGQAFTKLGRIAEANEQLKIAQSLTPDDPDVLYNLAKVHANNNNLPQAIELFERALKVRPNFAKAQNDIGIAYHRSGDVRRAAEHFQRFQQLMPNEPGAYANLAIIATGNRDFKLAATLYEHTVRLQPDSPIAHFSLAGALAQIGRSPEAIEHFQKALELNPNLLPAYAPLADALATANRGQDAVSVARRGIEVANALGDKRAAEQLQETLARFQLAAPANK